MVDFIDNHTNVLKDAVRLHLSETKEALFALAFIRNSGVNLIISDIENMIRHGGKISILFANDFGATEGTAVETLLDIGAGLKYYSRPNSSFHLKAYLFKKTNSGVAIIGSSNLSASGLTTGTEWSICAKSDEIDFPSVLLEYQNLWNSEYSKNVSDELINQLNNQKHSEDLKKTIHEEDLYPNRQTIVDADALINDPLNYVVTRTPTPGPWFFQIYKSQLNNRAQQGAFNIVVICDNQSPTPKVFSIPYSFLKENILPYAHLERNDRYLFNVSKGTLSFNWSRRIKMDGRKFLVK